MNAYIPPGRARITRHPRGYWQVRTHWLTNLVGTWQEAIDWAYRNLHSHGRPAHGWSRNEEEA